MTIKTRWIIRLAQLIFNLTIVFLISAHAVAGECDVRLGESRVDFGHIPRPNSIGTTNLNQLHDVGQRSVSFTASCDSAGELELIVRGDPVGNEFRFSRGGQVSVTVRNAMLDGRSIQLATHKVDGSNAGSYSSSAVVGPGDTLIPMMNGFRAKGSVWSMTMEIRPKIRMADLRTADAKTPEANLAFEVRQR